MKLILKHEVDHLGLPGDVVDVADGYGRNYLIPRGLAIPATKGAMKEAEALTRARKAREAKTLDDAAVAKQALESRTLRIAARVDDRGRLYGSVSVADVARVLKERGHDVPRKRIELRGTIKQIGSYEIPVQVHPQVAAMVRLEVLDEEGKVVVRDGAVRSLEEEAPAPAGELEALAEQALEAAEELEQQEADAASTDADADADAEAEAEAAQAAPEES